MVKVITVGCRLNQAEGERLTHIPTTAYHTIADSNAQVYIINTCAVTREATRRSWKMIKRCIKLQSASGGQNSKLFVTGCLATLELEKMLNTPGIDGVITHTEKTKLLENQRFSKTAMVHLRRTMAISKEGRSRPVIKIQDGCPNECSFCIARTIRGKPKSLIPEKINAEILDLARLGYKEIVLTGLNLGYYGRDIDSSLIQLLKSFNLDDGRIRLSSIESDTITDELLDLFKEKRLCRHLHIPLQSGDNRILKLMRRKYTADSYRNLINKILEKISGINIGTDIIVGFPYEDETAFTNSLKLIEKLPFGYLHVFPYSPRPGTEANKLPDTVKASDKKERVRILREVSLKKKHKFRQKFIGKSLETLVEENNIGITDNYIRVRLPQNENYEKGQLYLLEIRE